MTEQTAGVKLWKLTGSPDVAVAFNESVVPTDCVEIVPKLSDWLAGVTEYTAVAVLAAKPVCEGVKQAVIE
jgi:hypothetical protein